VVCSALSPINDGTIMYSVTGPMFPVDTTATYSCNVNYMLNGADTRTCMSDGTFDGEAPTCERTYSTTVMKAN